MTKSHKMRVCKLRPILCSAHISRATFSVDHPLIRNVWARGHCALGSGTQGKCKFRSIYDPGAIVTFGNLQKSALFWMYLEFRRTQIQMPGEDRERV